MKSKLTISKIRFSEEIKNSIAIALEILERSKSKNLTKKEFEKLEKEFRQWVDENLELLKHNFDNPINEYFIDFRDSGSLDLDAISDVIYGTNPDDIRIRYNYFTAEIKSKIETLESLDKKLKYISSTENENTKFKSTGVNKNKESMKKFFVSHSSKDIDVVEKVIDILEAIGVPSSQIFCSSFEGYGVKLGSDFLETIKKELDAEVLVLFILSSNYYSSAISICEMGATWIKTNEHIPILIPPFNYEDIKGVIPTTHGMKINEKAKFNSLKEKIENFIGIKPINISIWERRRNKILKEIKQVLGKRDKEEHKDNYYENCDSIIKKQSQNEWPGFPHKQLDYIQDQKKAVEKLMKNKPRDIADSIFSKIRNNARLKWPNNYEMQLNFEEEQIEIFRRK
jgi:hypothetical protein